MKKVLLHLVICISFAGSPASWAQEILLRKGTLTDSLPVNDSISETFAIYLPRNFTAEKQWPVIFVLDPQGRGSRAAQLFRTAAETQGYIIAASNDIKPTGSLEEHIKISARLLEATARNFPLNKNRIYFAGFKEGAQVASAMPFLFKQIRGVLTAGDIWVRPKLLRNQPALEFAMLVGYKDNNLYPILDANRLISRLGNKALLYKTEGADEWPAADVIFNAVAGFTLAAMDNDPGTGNADLADELYSKEMKTAARLKNNSQLYKAWELLGQMEKKYEVWGKEEEIGSIKKETEETKIFRKQRREYRAAARRELELKESLIAFLEEDLLLINFENLGWWNQRMKELEKLQQGKSTAYSEMAYRLQGHFRSVLRKKYLQLESSVSSVGVLIFTAILQTIFDRENPEPYMKIISLSAKDGDYTTALFYLEDLLKTGYDDAESLYSIPGTLDLRLSPEFNRLIKEYLGESRFDYN